MLQLRLWIRVFAVTVLLVASGACKTRDPDAAGVLSYETGASEDLQPSGTVKVSCSPAQGAEGDPVMVRYIISIAGAINDTDEGQPVLVTVEREFINNGQRDLLSSYEAGRGAVSKSGSIFVGFPSGVLNANYGAASWGNSTHGGVMTLTTDADATALSVNCDVTE